MQADVETKPWDFLYFSTNPEASYDLDKRVFFDEFTYSLNEERAFVTGDVLVLYWPANHQKVRQGNYWILQWTQPHSIRIPAGCYYYIARTGASSTQSVFVTFNPEDATSAGGSYAEVTDSLNDGLRYTYLYLALLPAKEMEPVEDDYKDLLE